MQANVTTTSSLSISVPVGALGVIIQNESDTDIRLAFNKLATTTGIFLTAATGSLSLMFPGGLTRAFGIAAIHAGSGTKVLTYDIIN